MNRNNFLHTILSLIVATTFFGCNNNKGRGINTGANIGAYPTNTCLLNPNNTTHCNRSYEGNQGFFNYSYTMYMNGLNNNYANGFCGCGANAFPVYQNSWGLGCVDYSYLPQNNYGYGSVSFLMYSWDVSRLQWTSTSPNYYMNNMYNPNACGREVILACDASQQGSCGPSAVCMPFDPYGNASYGKRIIGVCVMNQNSYYKSDR
jgi:hypothetical protein